MLEAKTGGADNVEHITIEEKENDDHTQYMHARGSTARNSIGLLGKFE